MRYIGGKVRLAKHLVAAMNIPDDAVYVEPFIGGGATMWAHSHIKNRIGGDAHRELTSMLRHVRDGHDFCTDVTRAWYDAVKNDPRLVDDATRGFIGFGSSMHGAYFRGFVGVPNDRKQPGNKRTLAESTMSCLRRDRPRMHGVKIFTGQYWQLPIPDGAYVYCDPPYAGTTGYSVGEFDHDEFWRWATHLSRRCTVYVSELNAPREWTTVWERNSSVMSSGSAKRRRVEKLFKLEP